jgi:hypothetical protein
MAAKRRGWNRVFERVAEDPVNVPEASAAGLPPLVELLAAVAAAAGPGCGAGGAIAAVLRRLAGVEAAEAVSALTEGVIGMVQQGLVDHEAALDELQKLAAALGVVTGALGAHGGDRGVATGGAEVVSELPKRRRGDACMLRVVLESGLLYRCAQVASLPVMIVAAIVEAGGGAVSSAEVKNWRVAEARFLEVVFDSIVVCFCAVHASFSCCFKTVTCGARISDSVLHRWGG